MRVKYAIQKHGLETKWARRQRLNKTLIDEKICASCDKQELRKEFASDHRSSDGLSSQCNSCRSITISAWQKENYDLVLRRSREWKDRNREHTRQYARDYGREHYAERQAYLKQWFKDNPGMGTFYRRQREARRRDAEGFCTKEQLKARVEYYGGLCWMCKNPADTIDHIKPVSKGGSEWPANLRPACRSCNSAKNASWPL
jgi:5-methylcytosine-specific restriction endonuclease McrA